MGRLDVRIVEARNLPNTEMVGSPDPYVRVELDNNTHKTSVASSTTTPKWDEVFKFVIADPDSAQLSLKIYNKNLVSDDFMGSYKMSLAGLTKGEVKDSWILLQQCKTNAEIHIRLLAHDFGTDPHPGGAAVQQGVPTPPQQHQAPPQQQQYQQAPPQQQHYQQSPPQQQQYQRPPGQPQQYQQPSPYQQGGFPQQQQGGYSNPYQQQQQQHHQYAPPQQYPSGQNYGSSYPNPYGPGSNPYTRQPQQQQQPQHGYGGYPGQQPQQSSYPGGNQYPGQSGYRY